jgi:hypothetical protein
MYLCNQCLSPLMLWVRISIRARCTTLCDKACQSLGAGSWFSQNPPVSSTNKTDRHDITEILLKVALNIIKQTNNQYRYDTIFGGDNLYFYSDQLCVLCTFIIHLTFLNCLKINIYYELCVMVPDVLKKTTTKDTT